MPEKLGIYGNTLRGHADLAAQRRRDSTSIVPWASEGFTVPTDDQLLARLDAIIAEMTQLRDEAARAVNARDE
jgi:hypothetical protein